MSIEEAREMLNSGGLTREKLNDGPAAVIWEGKAYTVSVKRRFLVIKENRSGLIKKQYRFLMDEID